VNSQNGAERLELGQDLLAALVVFALQYGLSSIYLSIIANSGDV
jgi:hypothetical protein